MGTQLRSCLLLQCCSVWILWFHSHSFIYWFKVPNARDSLPVWQALQSWKEDAELYTFKETCLSSQRFPWTKWHWFCGYPMWLSLPLQMTKTSSDSGDRNELTHHMPHIHYIKNTGKSRTQICIFQCYLSRSGWYFIAYRFLKTGFQLKKKNLLFKHHSKWILLQTTLLKRCMVW